MAEGSASMGELERELGSAIGKGDLPMAVSVLNSILYKLGTKPEAKPLRLQLLTRKLEYLNQLKCTQLADDVIAQILKLDPCNLELKA